ncbi:hypothetical protein ABFS82_09G087800 [Erythranthe guttata]|uniref:BZIP domain-containing protein n=1 Tax=Erythranthe guttata TaxID=4155 RepID=A0A022Q393_ERYGU|nr:PREDICTED: uncharacterized protein LOC105976118 [Erythranthe guttata]EYU21698.1 hypothetical protein MIMGU_mgv1a012312mg [Erythranthe guttata]|eukprot:XP_012856865.1 PREDICTED: uncharacterized protein LOC105976118 [Erythranthe guttata]
MSGADDQWIEAAMNDDAVVAEFLVRLRHAPPPPPPPPRPKPAALLPLHWSVRQRRSKSISVNHNAKKLAHRGSPTTPLSWSGATSFSGGSAGAVGGGSEESSRLLPLQISDASRSKVIDDSEKTASKKSRKKKTLTELKDEENSLLKERRELKREMAALRVCLDREKVTNNNLKKMKIELQPRFDRESTHTAEASTSGQIQHESTAGQPIQIVSENNLTLQSCTSNASGSKFVVPDLNIPFDEPSGDVIVCGIR